MDCIKCFGGCAKGGWFHNDLESCDLIQKCPVTNAVSGFRGFEDYFFGGFTVSCGVLEGFIWITLLHASLVKFLSLGLRFDLKKTIKNCQLENYHLKILW